MSRIGKRLRFGALPNLEIVEQGAEIDAAPSQALLAQRTRSPGSAAERGALLAKVHDEAALCGGGKAETFFTFTAEAHASVLRAAQAAGRTLSLVATLDHLAAAVAAHRLGGAIVVRDAPHLLALSVATDFSATAIRVARAGHAHAFIALTIEVRLAILI